MLSIIIIAKNEEEVLPRLLNSIKKQGFKDYEIILSDANSTDNTRKIGKGYGCRIVNGGLPSVGRNNGTKIAKGDILLFLDSDAEIPKDFLANMIKEIKERKIDAATCKVIPISDKLADKLFYVVFNGLVRLTQHFYPHAVGVCIICTKKMFKKVGGFDESIKMAEDMDFVRRCHNAGGKFRVLRTVSVSSDIRRLEKDGRLKIAIKFTYGAIYRVLFGEMKNSPFKYELHGGVRV